MKRVPMPAPIFFAWLVLTLVLMGQGMRLAADRQADHEPFRPFVLLEGGSVAVPDGVARIVYIGDDARRLAVYQELPERRLLRWIEEGHPATPELVIPLSGLGPGRYLVADAPGRAATADQEMDRPEQSVGIRARFELLPD